MSVSKQQSFLRQYAKSGYLDKMNPEFDGIARKYYNEKKEHEKVHSIKVKLDKEVAFMERMERRIEKKLEKKEVELRYAKEVKDRFHSDLQKVCLHPLSGNGSTTTTPRNSRTTSRRQPSSSRNPCSASSKPTSTSSSIRNPSPTSTGGRTRKSRRR
jgi:hypothetical protein